MATITSANPVALASSVAPATTGDIASFKAEPGFLAEIRFFWQQFIVAAFDPYRPELHYMRGPGPACRAKHTAPRSH